MGEVDHQEIFRRTGEQFSTFCWNSSFSYVWWRLVPNRAPCHVKIRDMELVLGEEDKRVARIVLEEVEYNSTLFIGIEELAMRSGGQCLIEDHAKLRPEILEWFLGK